jgi:hypothetical protein
MRRRPRFSFVVGLIALVSAGAARAADTREIPLVHPVFVHLPDAPEDDAARRAFTTAATRYGLHPVEVIDIPGPPAPRAPALIKTGATHTAKLAFDDALRDLDAAAAEVAASGGDGLSTDDLSTLYLNRAMATARVDWNATADTAPTEARTRAFTDYLRAAALTPARQLNPREIPPQAIADFARAVEEIRGRPRGTLVVTGSADATVTLDGGAPLPVAGGVSFRDLVHGEHLIAVDEMGRAPWGATISFGETSQEVAIPARAPLALDPAVAGAHARRMGAKFALVAEPMGGARTPIALRLIDDTGVQRDAAMILSRGEPGLLDAAVMRLDEQARRLAQAVSPVPAAPPAPANLPPPVLIAAPPAKARFSEDPGLWAREHWPLLTAIGVVALSTIVFTMAVSTDSTPSRN